jgi:hypothetical protein
MHCADKTHSCLTFQQVAGLLKTVNDGPNRLSQHTKSFVSLVYIKYSTSLHKRHDQHT